MAAFSATISGSSCFLSSTSLPKRKILFLLLLLNAAPFLFPSLFLFTERGKSLTICAQTSVSDISVEKSMDEVNLPKGDMWAVHKFGGTCVGTSQRIKNVANIIISDDSERKLIVVSAMSKVTDMMYDLINKAQSRDDSYISALDAVLEKHNSTALDLLDEDDLATFLSQLHHDVSNLKAMLRAIYIG
ncbi:bifunctional aspartokinase/homoserine dehydrogenase 2, chloroplastic-like [Hibiscus syriacus]|uniref:bifunctional aspartokinase/homoserine dehydrogenase 2, chloroplastic-like n=1 Tax=Hibiscus syriacus TaxID=106335 RepID=UPI0019236D3F|nr:bifunctional aspartokinase/homoserine dehydrogenase 2, chloroplastic-like [Hibiscus syriacus]